MTTLETFESFVAQHCKDTPLPSGLDTKLSDLGLDSLDLLDLVLAIENEFACEIDMEKVGNETTLRELAGLLAE